eukprot:2259462-Pyramimonas_sp.AAC.1
MRRGSQRRRPAATSPSRRTARRKRGPLRVSSAPVATVPIVAISAQASAIASLARRRCRRRRHWRSRRRRR